jgi:hypothetical protein
VPFETPFALGNKTPVLLYVKCCVFVWRGERLFEVKSNHMNAIIIIIKEKENK